MPKGKDSGAGKPVFVGISRQRMTSVPDPVRRDVGTLATIARCESGPIGVGSPQARLAASVQGDGCIGRSGRW